MLDPIHYVIDVTDLETILRRADDPHAAWPCVDEVAARLVASRQAQREARIQGGPVTAVISGPSGAQTIRATETSVEELEADEEPAAPSLMDELTTEEVAQAETSAPRHASGAHRITLPKMATPRLSLPSPTLIPGDALANVPMPVKVAAGASALLVCLGLAMNALKDDGKPAHAKAAAAVSPTASHAAGISPSAGAALPDGCLGGSDVIGMAGAGGKQASTSTITQAGMTVPSPSGAAAAAATFMRLRLANPAPATRAIAYASVLSPDATPAAKKLPPAREGWETHVAMTDAHWQVVSGNGAQADIALLLTTAGTHEGATAAPSPFTVKVSLKLVNGEWRLRDVGPSPLTPAQLGSAPLFSNTKACS